jgi:hypothetical protein
VVAEPGLVRSRPDDIGEQHSRQHRVPGEGVWGYADEPLDRLAIGSIVAGGLPRRSRQRRLRHALDRHIGHQRGDVTGNRSGLGVRIIE